MATSFICEHTAEFLLVPALKGILRDHFRSVVPIFPWFNRELSGRSQAIHANATFHVISLFARRPKLSEDGGVGVTINPELVAYKDIASSHGTTAIAGCPVAANFEELSDCSLLWLEIDETYPYFAVVESIPKRLHLRDWEIASLARCGTLHSMDSFSDFLREVRIALPGSFLGPRYKPVQFLLFPH